jgi:HPt (histidine-containing phosphotransfer) domain-containing protein
VGQTSQKLSSGTSVQQRQVFKRDVLLRHVMDDRNLAEEVLGLFLRQLENLELADWSGLELAHEMHKLKGAAATVGAAQIEVLAAKWRNHGAELETKLKVAVQDFRAAAA